MGAPAVSRAQRLRFNRRDQGGHWADFLLTGWSCGRGTEPSDLADSKGNTPAGCAWTMFICLQSGEGGNPERIVQVTFLIRVGLVFVRIFFPPLDADERAAAEAEKTPV